MSCHQGLSPQAPKWDPSRQRNLGNLGSSGICCPRTQFPLLGDHSLPLSSLEVYILPTQARSIRWLILDGQVTPSEPLSYKESL